MAGSLEQELTTLLSLARTSHSGNLHNAIIARYSWKGYRVLTEPNRLSDLLIFVRGKSKIYGLDIAGIKFDF